MFVRLDGHHHRGHPDECEIRGSLGGVGCIDFGSMTSFPSRSGVSPMTELGIGNDALEVLNSRIPNVREVQARL